MRCWNCNRECPDRAVFCQHCEADLRDGPPEEAPQAEPLSALDNLPWEDVADPDPIASESRTADGFVRSVMVGACPRCGSSDTEDCGNDTVINDNTVGRCLDCGQFWCLECGEVLDAAAPLCPHWAVCDKCDASRRECGCGVVTWECDTILEWRRTRAVGPPAA